MCILVVPSTVLLYHNGYMQNESEHLRDMNPFMRTVHLASIKHSFLCKHYCFTVFRHIHAECIDITVVNHCKPETLTGYAFRIQSCIEHSRTPVSCIKL